MRRYFAYFLAVALVLAALSVWWLRRELLTPYYGAPADETFVDIPRGASSGMIADLLTGAGVLHGRLPFDLYLRWSGKGRRLKAGEYRFASPATPIQVIERLIHGDVYFHSITVPEGLTAHETVELVAHDGIGNLEAMKDMLRRTHWIQDLDPHARDLEGYLFPDTYRFSRRSTSEEIIRTMMERLRERLAQLVARHPIPPGWDMHRIMTLASLIEKEVKEPQERPLVASVLVNRLDKSIPLACDPTVIYALRLANNYDGNIRKIDLNINSPYNTYLHPGLPPGPIANPGAESIRAALSPAKTDYLFYVSRNDGTHEFSKDFRSHRAAVARFQKSLAR